ncbi:MAG: type II secretion system protein [Candidatus Hydrogenedentes bacterium]|jgi:prepilin-type N-terminal cleavage/methylation domain-containing protein|nr:type II secretion system protein [Candidatus Hydrogenedentota bacterium]
MITAMQFKKLGRYKKVKSGFTLVEIIVALSIVSLAFSIFISLFLIAVRLAAEERDNSIAMEVGENVLNLLVTCPDSFSWENERTNDLGLFPIVPDNSGVLRSKIPPVPTADLVSRHAHERNLGLYNKFNCSVWGRLLSKDAASYEVTVTVSWRSQGRAHECALTSAVGAHRIHPVNNALEAVGETPL